MKCRRSRARRRLIPALATVLVAGGALAVPASSAGAVAAADHVTITPDPSYQGQAWEGWGTSLVWFANATGDYPEEIREELARLVFGDEGLALNIARYNVGGGNAPDVPDYLRPGGAVEGWWRAPEGTTREDTDWWTPTDPAHWDEDADRTQRWWVERISDQIDHWEAFSNSPPWFQTVSGYVSGGFDPSTDQLRADRVTDFVHYLVGVVERLEAAHGIDIATLDPFNEPNTDYWRTTLGPDGDPVGGRQEGAHIGPELQQRVIHELAEALAESDADPAIAAMDETNPRRFAENWSGYSAETRELVDQLNVHTYGTAGRTSVRDLAKAADRPLWMSEVEGDWGTTGGQDFETMSTGLGLARHIVADLRGLEPTAWVFWQPVEDYDNMAPGGESPTGGNWGSVQLPFDCTADDTLETCPIRTNTKFDTARNFTQYIRPGDRLVGTDEPASVAAVRAAGDGASVVHVNDGTEERAVTLDLTRFGTIDAGAAVTPVVTDTTGALVGHAPVAVVDGRATFTVPAESVTTFVVDGVSGVAEDAALVQPGHVYQLTGEQSGRALTAEGDGAVIRDADPSDAGQRWRLSRLTEGQDNRQRHTVTSAGDGRVLAERDGRLVLTEAPTAPDPAAQWLLSTTGDGAWTLVNAGSGQLVEVLGEATGDGSPASVWPPTSGANQLWQIRDLTADR